MNQKDEKHMEKLVREAIQKEMESGPEPPLSVEEAWERLNQSRGANPKKKRFRRVNKMVVLAASFLIALTVILSFSPGNGSAFTTITDVFQKVQGEAMHLFFSSRETPKNQENAPTSEDAVVIKDSKLTSERMPLEEAKQETSFPIRIPEFVPDDFTLKDVTVFKWTGEVSREISLHYTSDSREFMINQKFIEESFGMGLTSGRDDVEVKQISIKGNEATLMQYKNKTVRLIWLDQKYFFSIRGKLTEEEVVKIARAL